MSISIEDVHRIIITADDYGVMRSIDLGILEAVKKGTVSSVSVMSNFERFSIAIEDLLTQKQSHNPTIGIGLHINLTAGSAITGTSSLTSKNGDFLSANKLLKQINTIKIEDLENEIEAQISRLKGAVGTLDHLTHHMNIMCLHPLLFDTLIKYAKKYNLAVRNPFSMSFDQSIKTGFPPIKKAIAKKLINSFPTIIKKPSLLPTLISMSNTSTLLQKLKDEGIKTTTQFCDLFYGQPTINQLRKAFANFKPGQQTEIMTHPGYHVRTEMVPNGIDPSYLAKREHELSTLLSDNFLNLFNDKMVLINGFSAL